MIERYVFVRLKPEYATEAGRAEVRERSQHLATIPGVLGVAIGAPADDDAAHAWDLSLVVRFAALADVDAYLDHAAHAAYYEAFLLPRLLVIKAWNFAV